MLLDLLSVQIEVFESKRKEAQPSLSSNRSRRFSDPVAVFGRTLIFVETKRMADSLTIFLQDHDIPANSIHGDRTQHEREMALDQFRNGRFPLLVATAVAARGLDIPHVAHVINYDLPTDIDDYVHRIGRTGRAGNKGIATAFFNRGNRNISRQLVELLQEAKQEVPDYLTDVARESGFGRTGGGRGGSSRNRGHSNNRDMRNSGFSRVSSQSSCLASASAPSLASKDSRSTPTPLYEKGPINPYSQDLKGDWF